MIKTSILSIGSTSRVGNGLLLAPHKTLALLALVLMLAAMPFSTSSALAEDAKTAPVAQTVNINTADAQTLAAVLNGVGSSRAEDIIRHRKTYGPFSTVDELTEVKGIGQSTLDKNRAVITLE